MRRKTYPARVIVKLRWATDVDYLNKLTPEEYQWLQEYTKAFYCDHFEGDMSKLSKKERRKAMRARNAMRRDIMNAWFRGDMPNEPDEDERE